jgi:hypothetical protein
MGHFGTAPHTPPTANQHVPLKNQPTGTLPVPVNPTPPEWWTQPPWVSAWQMYFALPLSGRHDDGRASSIYGPPSSNATVSQALDDLVECGADPAFLTMVLDCCRQDPVAQRLRALLERISLQDFEHKRQGVLATWGMLQTLEAVVNSPSFPVYSARTFRSAVSKEQARLRKSLITTCQPILDAIIQTETEDPLLPLLELGHLPKRRRGRPFSAMVTFWMVVVTDHMRERTRRPYYPDIGHATEALFPGTFEPHILENASTLWHAVEDRCTWFKRHHDVATLTQALLINTANHTR